MGKVKKEEQKVFDDCYAIYEKSGDYTVLDELLHFIPKENLIQALPEEKWEKYK